jgi:hypothetical protein
MLWSIFFQKLAVVWAKRSIFFGENIFFYHNSSSSLEDRRKSHVAAGPSVRLGLWDRPLTISPKLKTLLFFPNVDVGFGRFFSWFVLLRLCQEVNVNFFIITSVPCSLCFRSSKVSWPATWATPKSKRSSRRSPRKRATQQLSRQPSTPGADSTKLRFGRKSFTTNLFKLTVVDKI